MNRILIVNVNWVGDVLFSTPLIRAVREKFPDAYIACMVAPRCKEVLELNPRLNEIIIYDEAGAHKGPFGKLRLISYLRSKRFDTAILLHRSMTRALIAFMAGIPKRIGYYTRKRSRLLTEAAEIPSEEMHRVDFFLNLGKPLGVSAKDRNYEFFISDKDRETARNILAAEGVKPGDKAVVINPGGNWAPKRWPKENFAKLADELTKRFNARIIITGAKEDIGLAGAISSQMSQRPAITCGKTSLRELAAMFERADLIISNDSGPLHIAVSMGAKAVALFGPTTPRITGPVGKGVFVVLQEDVGCEIPCYDLSCGDHKCMSAITVEDALEAAGKLLNNVSS